MISVKLSLYILTIIITLLTIGFILNREFIFVFHTIVIYIIYVIGVYYQKKGKIKTTKLVNLLFVIVITLDLGIGQYFKVYQTSTLFDKALHIIGIFTISLFLYHIILPLFKEHSSSNLLLFILVSSVGISVGAFFEIIEFALDYIFSSNNQKSLLDTDLDMICNSIGASLAGLGVLIKRQL